MARLTNKIIRKFPIPGDPDNAYVKILHLKAGEIQKMESETSHWEYKNNNGEIEQVMYSNLSSLTRRMRTAALVGWGGFYDGDGSPLTDDQRGLARNREQLLDEDPILGEGDDEKPLTAWIDEFRNKLAEELKEDKADPNL